MSDLQGPKVSRQAASDVFGFSPRWLSKLVDQGYVEREENGLFDLIEVGLGYIRFLKDADRRASQNAPANAIIEAKTRKLQIDIAKKLDALIETDLAEECANTMMAALRDVFFNLDPLPDSDIDAAFKARIKACFERGEKRFADFFVALRAGRPTGFDDDDDHTLA